MEQISVLIGHYADGITAATGIFAMILLAVALHRIKQIEKTQRRVLESLSAQRQEDFAGMPNVQKAQDVAPVKDGVSEARTEAEPAVGSTASVSEKQMQQDAAELLDAVLEEVFP